MGFILIVRRVDVNRQFRAGRLYLRLLLFGL